MRFRYFLHNIGHPIVLDNQTLGASVSTQAAFPHCRLPMKGEVPLAQLQYEFHGLLTRFDGECAYQASNDLRIEVDDVLMAAVMNNGVYAILDEKGIPLLARTEARFKQIKRSMGREKARLNKVVMLDNYR